MRQRPFAFLKVGDRWINMALVTDIEDHGDSLVVFVASDMARLAGGEKPVPMDVARRFKISEPAQVEKLRLWIRLNDVE